MPTEGLVRCDFMRWLRFLQQHVAISCCIRAGGGPPFPPPPGLPWGGDCAHLAGLPALCGFKSWVASPALGGSCRSLVLSHINAGLVSCGGSKGRGDKHTGRGNGQEVKTGQWSGKCRPAKQRCLLRLRDPAPLAEMVMSPSGGCGVLTDTRLEEEGAGTHSS